MHLLLYPLSLLYGLITALRNLLYDRGLLHTETPRVPTICVGNLAVGGTGKTPHTEYILAALQSRWHTAMLSRGYRRKTRGFAEADAEADAHRIGDEPYQIHRKFPHTAVAVDEDRLHGARELLRRHPETDVIVLDDAMQHRRIRPGFCVLLTDYARLYTRDCLLPAGRLRESRRGSRRADVIVVTKCPPTLTAAEQEAIRRELKPDEGQSLFFSTYRYLPCDPYSRKKDKA